MTEHEREMVTRFVRSDRRWERPWYFHGTSGWVGSFVGKRVSTTTGAGV